MGKCKNCGIKLIKSQKVYCDNSCQQKYLFESKTIIKFEGGLISHQNTIRKVLKYKYGAFCYECNQGEIWNGKDLTLQVDHIDGDSDNNKPNNLRLLCPNCHTQTPTFSTRQKKDAKRNRYLRSYKGTVAQG